VIFNEIQIKNGRLTYNDGVSDSRYTLSIDRFSAVTPGIKHPLTIEFRGAFNNNSFEIQATLGVLFSAIKNGEPLAIDLTAKTKGTTVKIEGLIRDPAGAGGLDCELTAAGSSILHIMGFSGITGVPDIGPYRLTARVTGSADQLTIDRVDLSAGSENQLRAVISGSLRDLLKMQGIELAFQFRGKDVASLETLFDLPVPLTGAYALSGRLNDPATDVYRFSGLVADLGDNKITGSVVFDLSAHRSMLTAALAARNLDLSPVSPLAEIGLSGAESIANLGPFKLIINANGPFKQLSVEHLDFQAGNEDLAKISLQGSVKDLSTRRGIELNFVIQGKNIANLEKLINRPMPVAGAFEASGKIVDSDQKTYSFNSLNLIIHDSDISGSVDISLGGQRPQIDASLVSAKFNLKPVISYANPSDTPEAKSPVAASMSEKPSLDPPFPLDVLKAVDANIKVQTGRLLLPGLTVNRMVMDILLKEGKLMISARGPALPDISGLAGVTGLSQLGPYHLAATAREIDGRLVVEDLNLLAGKHETAEIRIKTAVADLMTLSGVRGRFTIRGNDSTYLAPLVGISLPFEGRFSAAGNLDMPEINFYRLQGVEILAGQNDVSGRVELNLTGKRPQLRASLLSQKMDLRPLLESADDQKRRTKKSDITQDRKNKAATNHPLFTDALTLADVEFNLHVSKLLIPNLLINDFNLGIDLQGGRYDINAESRTTPDIAELTGVTDLGPSRLNLKGVASADKLTVEKLDYHTGTREIFEIKLNGSAEDLLTWRGITLSFEISGNDAANFERFIKKPVPYKDPFIFSGRLTDPLGQIYKFDQIRIIVGDSHLAGWSDINLTGDRPRIKAELTSRKMDLRWLSCIVDEDR
jgi:hypothetical protein